MDDDGNCAEEGWHLLVPQAKIHGTWQEKFNSITSGTFSKIKAVRTSGCAGCSTSYSAMHSANAWQCCAEHGSDYQSFELMHNSKMLFEQTACHVLPSECSGPTAADALPKTLFARRTT
jgi:hypothetical protein